MIPRRLFPRVFLVFSILLVVSNAETGEADIITVCPSGCHYSSIQSAINNANPGDTVEVRAGTYNEYIIMKDQVNVVNYSSDVPVIDADTIDHSAVIFEGEFSHGCILDGFEITNVKNPSNAGIYIGGTGTAGIDNKTAITDCNIHDNSGPGIKIDGSTSITAPTIDSNNINDNSQEGTYIVDAGSNSEDAIIVNNTIQNNTLAGINIGGDSYVTVGENNDINNNYVGIAFDTGDPSSKPVMITGNNIHHNDIGGIEIADAIAGEVTITQNHIHSNTTAGIGIKNSCTLVITKNAVEGNVRGGIKTGDETEDPGGFDGTDGTANLTIKQNKVYGNGASGYGGGIDVRHADGTIYNNLVYENHRGGIRFGDWIDEIINNTVSDNGNDNGTTGPDPDDDIGGGIIYDDINAEDAVNAPPTGTPPDPPDAPDIKNNICAYNYRAGIRACFTNTPGSEEQDYNLVHFNNGMTDDCGWYTSEGVSYVDGLRCPRRQFGGCGVLVSSPPQVLDGPHNIIADPLFEDRVNDDYRIKSGSLAKDAGDTNYGTDLNIPPAVGTSIIDMGAYGGDGINWNW